MKRILLALLMALASPAWAATYDQSPEGNARFLADFAALPGVTRLKDGLMYRVVQDGGGKGTSPISRRDFVWVEYKGWTVDGQVFDATKGDPKRMETGNLIPGWTEALFKMKTGDTWQVVIPAALAYGAQGRSGVIGPNQTLVFLVKLEKVEYP
jgi:FKBP-type peptidyl-prolyl cis-trans isomerase